MTKRLTRPHKKTGRKPKPLLDRLKATVVDYAMITRLAETGDTDEQIGYVVGKTEKTIDQWKSEDPAFELALKKGKAVSDSRVVKCLFQRAVGYEYDEVHKEFADIVGQDGKATGLKSRKIVTIRKTAMPDVTAQIFWLKNRMPTDWRDRQEFRGSLFVGWIDLIEAAYAKRELTGPAPEYVGAGQGHTVLSPSTRG